VVVNNQEKHLSVEEIECLVASELYDGQRSEGQALRERGQSHLARCELCKRLLAEEIEADHKLRDLSAKTGVRSGKTCPSMSSLYELAGGVLNDKDHEALMKHVVECDYCGPAFRRATSDFAADSSPEEALTMESLKTSSTEWQKAFLTRLIFDGGERSETTLATTVRQHSHLFSAKYWGYALAAVLVVAFVTIEGERIWSSRPSRTQGLLAEAYSARRNIEVRILDSPYGPVRVTRGSHPSNFDRPAALSDAERLIQKALVREPESVFWLQSKIRADLLDGNYDSALRTAESALKASPSAFLLNDLACAYFLRAETERSVVDYGKALDNLSAALAMAPNDTVLLFNRAIVSERLNLYTQAQEDWIRYLKLETDSQWRAEADARLKTIEQKLNEEKRRSEKVLDDPDKIIADIENGQQERIAKVDSAVDLYQKLAVETWLPDLKSGRVLDATRRASEENALNLLAAKFMADHQDSWLRDFLAARFHSPSVAIQELADALKASSRGNQEKAIQLASTAERDFQKERNEPGRLMATFEKVYANQLAAHGEVCHADAERLLEELSGRNYAWIEIQSQLGAAACANETSQIDESIRRSLEALNLAKAAHYGNLQLRATMFAADLNTDPIRRLNLLLDGLSMYWNGDYEPMRGYSLYASMDTTSGEDLHLWYFNEAVIKEGLHLLERDPDLALRGLEQYRLARAQIIVGETDDAKKTITEGRTLLAKSDSPALTAGASVDLAEAFLITGRYRDSLDQLASAQPYLADISQDIVTGRYYSIRAAALLGTGQSIESEESFLLALRIAQKGLKSISDERDRYSWMQTLEPGYRSLVYAELQKDALTALRLWESFRGGSISPKGERGKEPLSIESLETDLPWSDTWSSDSTVLLSYASFPDGIAVWGYDGKRVEHLWLPSPGKSIESLAFQFHEGCADPTSDPQALFTHGHELYGLLVKPVEAWLKGRTHVIVELDTSMESIPFEALINDQGKYLADIYEIKYSPGLAYINLDKRPGTISRASRALVIGQSLGDTEESLPRLPGSSEEAHDVASLFDNKVLLTDDDATLPRIVKELPRAEVFHFAGHAVGNRRRNGLLLANSTNPQVPRFLDAQNINVQLLRQSRLVVLSACSTANGTGMGVEDRESLARNILAAGVPNVVASRWVVDSLATREWMRVFYADAVTDGDVGSAAQRAGIVLRNSTTWRHPFYWASFSVFV
jgi:CHAT domain-containing protein